MSKAPRRLRFGLTVVALELAVVVLGPLWLPDPNAIVDPRGAGLLPPLSRVLVVSLQDDTSLAGSEIARTPDGLLLRRGSSWEKVPENLVVSVKPRWYLLGSDALGRDVAARLVKAGQISLSVGVLSLALAVTLGTLVGMAAGLGPRFLDRVLMAFVDAALALPLLFVLLAASAFLRPSLGTVVLMLGFFSWMGVARLVRGQALLCREQPWFLAAKGLGLKPLRLAFVHVFPHVLTPLTTDATLRLGDLILLEAALSFLGFGVPPPIPSWGSMAAEGFEVWRLAFWLPVFPGFAVALSVLAFATIADGLGELARGERLEGSPA
ncbi:MAG: ABC transporter permease [Acidobacteriota bacterium]|mgnify:CR=1 FL=1|uniref:ABC transporter permease n=1 Tax=Thermoanaerobaculum aquaticum TaxID=1312852 RepID=A0A7C2S7K4_9BACT